MYRRLSRLGWLLCPGLLLGALAVAPSTLAAPPDAGRSYRVPYRLTDTNHFLVRVRLNGKGPFNFLVDTGAPAFYVSTETAKKIELKPVEGEFWTPVERLEFEGGASLVDLKARVEDPFQLVGMNALGLPGASIDGILGFTILARFKITLDPTQDRMTWTRLDFDPKDPPVPKPRPGDRPPAEMQAMNALGPIAKFAAAFVGRQPEVKLVPRGYLGVELEPNAKGPGVRLAGVLAGSPAEKAGLKAGDRLVRLAGRPLADAADARAAFSAIKAGERVVLSVRKAGTPADAPPAELSLNAGEGL